jgi:hypothetical protein
MSHETEQRGLEDAERLAQAVGVRTQPPPHEHTEERRAEHDAEDEQAQLEAAQPEEHGGIGRAAADSTGRSIMRDGSDGEGSEPV